MKPALLSLRIITVLNTIISIILILASVLRDDPIVFGLGVFIGVFSMLYHLIHRGLVAKKYWAWVAGIIVSGMYTFSLFFPLGIMGLVGLLKRETRQDFNRIADLH